jgi:hypothetical protein
MTSVTSRKIGGERERDKAGSRAMAGRMVEGQIGSVAEIAL